MDLSIVALATVSDPIKVGSGSLRIKPYSASKNAEVSCTFDDQHFAPNGWGAGRPTTGPAVDFAAQQGRNKQVPCLENSLSDNHLFSQAPIYTFEDLPEMHPLGSGIWSGSALAQSNLKCVWPIYRSAGSL